MKEVNILFGFDNATFQKRVEKRISDMGYQVNNTCKYSKKSISDFLKEHPEYDKVVLLEMVGRNPYAAEELAALADDRDINIVVILNEHHRGEDYVKILYSAGITSALFQAGTNSQATPANVTELIMHKRPRKEARAFYRIEKATLDLDVISPGKVQDYLHALEDVSYGQTMGKRFMVLVNSMSVPQIVEFINSLPLDTKKELEGYQEFYVVLQALKEKGINIQNSRYKKGMKTLSRKKNVGMKESIGIEMNDSPLQTSSQSNYGEELNQQTEEMDYFAQMDNTPKVSLANGESNTPMDEDVHEIHPQRYSKKELKKELKEKERQWKEKQKQDEATAREQRQSIAQKKKEHKMSKQKPVHSVGEHSILHTIFIRLVVTIGIIAVIFAIVGGYIAISQYSRAINVAKAEEQKAVTEQMADLAELRGESVGVATESIQGSGVANPGEMLMGIDVMDIINTNQETFYVMALDGSIYTYEAGGASSAEIDVNSMYSVTLLSSGRYAFSQL